MLSNLFIEQVKKHFHYLLDSYKFSITDERVGFDNFGNALVQFKSKKVLLRITLDRGQVFIYFLPRPKFRYDWFSFSSVMNFLYPGISIDIFPKEWNNYDEMVNEQIAKLSHLLPKYCDSILRGRFSKWKELDKKREDKSKKEYRDITGEDLP